MSERPATTGSRLPADVIAGELPTIPGYEILAELGRGGMGVVYRARHGGSNRLVALKMIRDSALAGPQERGRFRIEAEAAARMRHPNIVPILEVGEHAGRPFFAMQLIEGESLADWIAKREAQIADAHARDVGWLAQIADAVQHAHERGIVHRDLKPANILLQRAADAGGSALRGSLDAIPMVTDFSLAKRLDTESTAWTHDGSVLGTINYMAPEQAAGRVRDIGPAVDIYALGAILYEMLTGRPPFQAETWNETLQLVLLEEPTPPTRLRPDLPRDLETVCLKCLEKQPDRRYARAADLAHDLRRFVAGRPVSAVPLAAGERLSRFAARDGYEIVAEIGRGPRSVVYHALYDRLKQPVALKVFHPGTWIRSDWDDRISRATSLAGALTHPQIVPVQRAGWWDGAAFVALEFVPFGSLARKLTGRPFRVHDAVLLVEQLSEIAAYIHRQGVVHGNLKPSNVLFAADDIPRLSDLHLTGGPLLATPADGEFAPAEVGYLPPERARDAGVELRLSADIYGLGAILYELLTGRPPFAGATADETLEQIVSQEPAPPSALNPGVTPNLDAICLHCLRKNPWRRYVRAFELTKRLRSFLEDPDGRSGRGGRLRQT
jgi:serine/threonine protein kinase